MKLQWTKAMMLSLGLAACSKSAEPAAGATGAPAAESVKPAEGAKSDKAVKPVEAAKPEEAAEPGETAKPEEPNGAEGEKVKAAVAAVGAAAGKIEGVDQLAAKAEDLAAMAKNVDKAPLDAAAYEQLMVDHAACEVTASGDIDPKCPAVKALREASSGGQALKALAGGASALGKKLIAHASPAVRIKAAGLMASMLGTSDDSQDLIVAAAKTETHPGVIQALVGTVSNDGAKNPKVAELLLWAADHADTNVRKKAIYALTSTWNREMAGGPEKIIAKMEGDPDAEVRATACKYAGKLGDGKFMPSYTKLTADGTDPDLKANCMEGLIEMWWSYPFHENANEDAYKLTLALFSKKPRTEKDPFWTLPGSFQSKNDDKIAAWKAKAPWFKAEEVTAVLSDIVKDTNANWMARTGAVDSIGAIGTKADLEALLSGFPEDAKGNDSHVRQKLTETIAKAK